MEKKIIHNHSKLKLHKLSSALFKEVVDNIALKNRDSEKREINFKGSLENGYAGLALLALFIESKGDKGGKWDEFSHHYLIKAFEEINVDTPLSLYYGLPGILYVLRYAKTINNRYFEEIKVSVK
ncbi:lanthionine synthetase LanC family protein [Ureibacillus sp. MALMAid1270]|uniref:lanthionine synthetase LanC family protein n=1 Tax=Ureibacillus sp. MALMAid1270 TaxID=3411629 RepID=UPI003BA74176